MCTFVLASTWNPLFVLNEQNVLLRRKTLPKQWFDDTNKIKMGTTAQPWWITEKISELDSKSEKKIHGMR